MAIVTQVVRRSGDEVTIEVTVRLSDSLMDMEASILEASNAVGRCATEEALGRFDTDGSPMRLGETKLTARGPRIGIDKCLLHLLGERLLVTLEGHNTY